jgi:NAD-dependent dihydropyrimidine dehydrogenase PreA subunit
VPVNKSVDTELQVHRYEDMRSMMADAKSFRLMECVCRKERALAGHPCAHEVERCLSFSSEEGAWDNFMLTGKIISKEEAFKVLADAEQEGLVHCTWNVQQGHVFLCNCCPCSCGILRAVKEFKAPYMLAKSNFVAQIRQDYCTACGVCRDERCPMEAIAEEDGTYRVMPERCIGCGVCTVTCPSEAITLINRPQEDREEPLTNIMEWSAKRTASRGMGAKVT